MVPGGPGADVVVHSEHHVTHEKTKQGVIHE